MLQDDDRGTCLIEVKNCTMVQDGIARFPDAVTARGLKHLQELSARLTPRNRSAMFYFIQRMDAEVFRPADDIDPAYGKALRQALEAGVEILAYDVHIDLQGIRLNRRLPARL
jgi:sugar fermentation stimulation protein A